MGMLDYRIDTFLTLCEQMNYRKTADLLHISQPAVTQQIHHLETRYGQKLFEYENRRLVKTEAAANLSLNSASLNRSIEIRENLLDIKKEREALEATPPDSPENADAYEKIAKLKSREIKLADELKALEGECESIVLTTDELADVVEAWTGVPALTVSPNE